MKKVEFDLRELQKVPEKIRRQTMNKWMLKALHRYGMELEALVVDQIQDMGINFHGDLMKSIKSQVKKELNGFLLNVGTNLKTKSGYPYPVGVHEGTKPHWTPKNVIREWVRLKLNIKKEPELSRATFFIRRKIATKGIKGRPFMQIVFKQEKRKMADKISKHLAVAMGGGKI